LRKFPDVLIVRRSRPFDRAYQLATTSNARLESELAEDEEWLQSVLGGIPEIPDESSDPDPGETADAPTPSPPAQRR